MKIAATTVSMDAAKNYTEVDHTNTNMQQGLGGPFSFNQPQPSTTQGPFQASLFSLIHSSTSSMQSSSYAVSSDGEIPQIAQESEDTGEDAQKSDAFTSLIEHISGTSISINQIQENRQNRLSSFPPVGVGMASLNSSAVHYEEESVFFHAGGSVETEDGQSIAFNLGLQMQRRELSIQGGLGRNVYGIDPLVLNFDDTISIFDENYFSFDLDGDGEKEELSSLNSCCGFLALDRNGDGSINNGLELFGPSTNSGFGELADLDDDGNAWIDENDPIFDDLMIWQGAGGEEEQLISLREAGVGAISVAHLGTQFNLEDSDGTVQGIVQSSGLFLMESGEPKSMMEIDLVPRVMQTDDDVAAAEDSPGNPTSETGQISSLGQLSSENQASINDLREIIFWQQLKMQMLHGRKLLSESHDDMMDRLKHLSSQMTFSVLS